MFVVNALIIDDEEHCTMRVKKLIDEQKLLNIDIKAMCDNITDAYEAILQHKPDLLFLDVQLHNKTCFDLLSKLKNINFDIIFTTASEQFAIQAFKFSAVDYLLKPIDKEEFLAALSRFADKRQSGFGTSNLSNLIQNNSGSIKKICIADQKTMEFIPVTDIVRCEAMVNYTNVYLTNKQLRTASKPLKDFEDLLRTHGFFRVHQSHLINMQFITRYDKGKGGVVHLSDGSEIEVSTRKKEEFLKVLALL